MSVLRSHNNKTRGGLGRVCATGMYRSIEHVKFPKFQTGIFVEWKAPRVFKIVRLKKGESKLMMFKIQYMDNFEVEFCCIF